MPRSHRLYVSFLLIVVFASVACGSTARRGGTLPNAHPDELQISVLGLGPDEQTVITVQQPETAQALYTAAAALPTLPENQVCPAVASTQYHLTFLEGGASVATAVADKGGCGTVTFGADDTLLASAAFWKLLDQIVVDNAPPVHPDRLDIVSFATSDQPPSLTSVTSAATAQRLYDALRALPPLPSNQPCQPVAPPSAVGCATAGVVSPQNQGCPAIAGPRYELAFYVGDKYIRATLDRSGCGSAQLLGGNVIPILADGAARQPDAAFWDVVDQALASAPAKEAQPDQAGLKIQPAPGDTTTSAQIVSITSPDLLRQLYAAAYALPLRPANFSCTPTSGTVYGLTFLKGNITLLTALIDEGACGSVSMFDGGTGGVSSVRLTTSAFEALLRQAGHA